MLNSKNGKVAILKNNLPLHTVQQLLRVPAKSLCEHKDMLYYYFFIITTVFLCFQVLQENSGLCLTSHIFQRTHLLEQYLNTDKAFARDKALNFSF